MTLKQILKQMKRTGVLEDRREYDVEDLQKMYELSASDATELFNLVQAEFAPTPSEILNLAERQADRKLIACLKRGKGKVMKRIRRIIKVRSNEHWDVDHRVRIYNKRSGWYWNFAGAVFQKDTEEGPFETMKAAITNVREYCKKG